MRGRVDASEGFPRPTTGGHLSINLIQKQEFGLALSKLLRIQERTPAPTLGSEIVPVIICDELLIGGYPPRRRCTATMQTTLVGANPTWVGVNCRGFPPQGTIDDKLVVRRVRLVQTFTGPITMFLESGRAPNVTGLGPGFALYNDTSYDQPASGVTRSDFTGMLFGQSADATDPLAHNFSLPPNVFLEIEGPWILNQFEALFFHTGAAFGSGVLSAIFEMEEYPRP